VKNAEKEGFRVVIAFAGMSAALAGRVRRAHTLLPVIGVPVSGGALGGVDAALSTLQMPPGTPVAAVAVDGRAQRGVARRAHPRTLPTASCASASRGARARRRSATRPRQSKPSSTKRRKARKRKP